MQDYIAQRVAQIAHYIIRTNATVREAAGVFKVSKSTVHKDMTERLRRVDPGKYKEVQGILAKNKAERHIRGGEATHLKYKNGYKKPKARNASGVR